MPVDAERVAACLGPVDRVKARPPLVGAVDEAVALAARLVRARAVLAAVRAPTACRPTAGPRAGAWSTVPWAVFFAATIGPDLEATASAEAAAGRLLRAVAIDAAGSAASLGLADAVVHRLATGLLDGTGLGPILLAFPGDDGFPMEAQPLIIRALPAEQLEAIGLRLLTSGALSPLKSIAGVIGLSAQPGAVPSGDRSCEGCPSRERCTFRRSSV
ncbi:MAG TPA: hypothetical protein VGL40_05135 [Bacillota bacterium]